MAGTSVIDAYLEDLRRLLRRTHDAEEILIEVQDHLLETIERLERDGLGSDAAAAEAVRRFGPAAPLSRALNDANGGAAMPTRFTRLAGAAGMSLPVVGLLAALVTASSVAGTSLSWLGAASWSTMAMLLVITVIGLYRRHGATGGTLARAGMALFAASPLLALPAGYGAGVMLPFVAGAGLSVLAVAWWRADVLPRFVAAAVAAVPPLAILVMGIGSAVHLDMGRYGVVFAGALTLAVAWLSATMWRETPVDAVGPHTPTVA
ncbi:MAG: permease prefix domain 1-containing protein [Actinobacteria bacterium]|nr:permease prefix domain 1-containing protein [Actinomycetota bacterium]